MRIKSSSESPAMRMEPAFTTFSWGISFTNTDTLAATPSCVWYRSNTLNSSSYLKHTENKTFTPSSHNAYPGKSQRSKDVFKAASNHNDLTSLFKQFKKVTQKCTFMAMIFQNFRF